MAGHGQGMWLPDQKRGNFAYFDGIAWRRFNPPAAAGNYGITFADGVPTAWTTSVGGGVTAVRSYISFGDDLDGRTYTP